MIVHPSSIPGAWRGYLPNFQRLIESRIQGEQRMRCKYGTPPLLHGVSRYGSQTGLPFHPSPHIVEQVSHM